MKSLNLAGVALIFVSLLDARGEEILLYEGAFSFAGGTLEIRETYDTSSDEYLHRGEFKYGVDLPGWSPKVSGTTEKRHHVGHDTRGRVVIVSPVTYRLFNPVTQKNVRVATLDQRFAIAKDGGDFGYWIQVHVTNGTRLRRVFKKEENWRSAGDVISLESGDPVTLSTRTRADDDDYYHLTADVGRGNRSFQRPSDQRDVGLVTVLPDRITDPIKSDQMWWIERVEGKGPIRSGDMVTLRTRTAADGGHYYHLSADVGRGNREIGKRPPHQRDTGLVTVLPNRNTDRNESDQIWWIEKIEGSGEIKTGDMVTLRTRTKTDREVHYHLSADVGRGNREIGRRPPGSPEENLGLVTVLPHRNTDPGESDQIWWIQLP